MQDPAAGVARHKTASEVGSHMQDPFPSLLLLQPHQSVKLFSYQ